MPHLSEDLLSLLRSVDTPTVCNAIEVAQGKRGFMFDLASRVATLLQLTTDGHGAYL